MKPLYIRVAVCVAAAVVVALSPDMDFDAAIKIVTGLAVGLVGPDVASAIGAKKA